MFFETELQELAPNLHVHLPDHSGFETLDQALEATTHLLIVAHADDDGLVGPQALADTFNSQNLHMTVVVVSASPGTNRPPGYEGRSDDEMADIRRLEQLSASNTGRYAATLQLGFSSDDIKGVVSGRHEEAMRVRAAIETILRRAHLTQKLYLHSIFDAHNTHHALTMLTLDAVRSLPPEKRPNECYGVEVSSGLAWLPPQHRVLLPVTEMKLVTRVLGNYATELAKRDYAAGFEGRAIANDVFGRDKGSSKNIPHSCALDYGCIVNQPHEVTTAAAMTRFKAAIIADFAASKMRQDLLDAYETLGSPAQSTVPAGLPPAAHGIFLESPGQDRQP